MAVAARAHVRTHFSRRAIVDYVLRSVGLAAK
jgi:hypothetical protein